MWFLSPGIGAQGGDLAKALKVGLREDGLGILLPISRGWRGLGFWEGGLELQGKLGFLGIFVVFLFGEEKILMEVWGWLAGNCHGSFEWKSLLIFFVCFNSMAV